GLYLLRDSSATAHLTRLKGVEVHCLYPDQKGLWAGTNQGLYQLDRHLRVQRKWLPPSREFPYERIEHLHQDRDGLFWMATKGAGLIRWDPQTGTARKYTEKEGLSNRNIHAVYEDAQGFLWLPSDFGLMRFHKASGQVQAFFTSDGIADNEFNAMSHFRSADGTLFFGGTNGVTAFHPDDIPLENAPTHRLRLMEVRTFRVKSAAYTDQMTEFDAGRPVTVSPDDDYLDVRVSPCLYEDVNQIRYSWKIEGYSEDWVQQQSPQIRLYNLPYGKYTLHVRYSMHGNIWSENELYIPLVVTRPFYLQWYFFLFTALVLAAGTWIFTNWRTRQLLRDNIKLEEEVANRTQQIEKDKAVIEQQARELRSLDELKSRFFANITHELRTPLTLILGPIEKIIKSADLGEKNRESALMVKRNAIKLLNLVEELLDLSRIEANKLVLIEKPVRLYPFLARILSMFTPYYEHRGIELRITYDCPSDLVLLMDAQKWEKIINN
ncbi:MAG: histidine kinase dimerization/phospho-acceptor domain-containing protein, partial [Bacteroidota bacterium]